LPVVLYGCKIWSLTLREEHRPRMFENIVLGIIFLLQRDEYEAGENCITRTIITCTLLQKLLE
jgi:hypothetical protein